MNILMVWDGDYPWDVRVEKVCKTLIAAGNQVDLVCRNSEGKLRREDIDGIRVRRVYALPPVFNQINKLLTFPAFFSPVWIYEIYRALRDLKPDLVIIRDLPIALGVLSITRWTRIPVVLDMAECYPEMLRCIWRFEGFRPQNVFTRNPKLADIVERLTVRNVNAIWAMVEESKSRLQRLGVHGDKIEIVSNTPPINSLPVHLPSREKDGSLKIVYVGLLNPSRGVETLIRAAKIVKDRGRKVLITIVGGGKDYNRLLSIVTDLGVTDIVKMEGWIDHDFLGPIFSSADVGIVPHYVCSHWDSTVPNKLFDYMAAGKPVLTSNTKPVARIIEACQCGLVYKDSDPYDLADKMEVLMDNTLRQKLAREGRQAVERRYNWSVDSSKMLASIENLMSSL